MIRLAILAALLLTGPAFAQEPPKSDPPALSELDTLRIKLLQAEANSLEQLIYLQSPKLHADLIAKRQALNAAIVEAAKAGGVDLKDYVLDPERWTWRKRDAK